MVNLWQHQLAMVQYMNERDYGLIAAGMRTGKTLTALTYIDQQNFNLSLVVTTGKGIKVWQDEISKYFPSFQTVVLASGSSTIKARQISAIVNPEKTIILVNYESVWRNQIFMALVKSGLVCIILDESHKIKAHNSMVSKGLHKLGRIAKKRFCMTGTPLPNSPLDIFGQARFLNEELFTIEGKRLLRSFNAFKDRYTIQQPYGTIKIVRGYKNIKELHEIMDTFTFRVESAAVLDLPDAVHINKYVELSDKARNIYDELNHEMFVELETGILTADNALVKALRLQQITGGFADHTQIDISKIEVLNDIINSLEPDEPLVIFSRFTDEISAMQGSLFSTSVLSGIYNELEDWKQGKTRILIVQIRTGSEAINLSRANKVVFYSNDYSAGVYEQALARVAGHDQIADKVTYYHLISANTIDEAIQDALLNKKKIKDSIMKNIRSYDCGQHSIT